MVEGLTVEELADLKQRAAKPCVMALASPTIVALITQVERLTAERDEARAERQSLRRNLWDALDPDGALYDDDDANTVKIIGDIKARADTLAAENERLQRIVTGLSEQVDAMAAGPLPRRKKRAPQAIADARREMS